MNYLKFDYERHAEKTQQLITLLKAILGINIGTSVVEPNSRFTMHHS